MAGGLLAMTGAGRYKLSPIRRWVAERSTRGPVTISYRMPAGPSAPLRAPAPPIGSSNDGGGFSAAWSTILLLPAGERNYDVRVAWGLSDAPPGAAGSVRLTRGRQNLPSFRDHRGSARFTSWPVTCGRCHISYLDKVSSRPGRESRNSTPRVRWHGPLIFRVDTPPSSPETLASLTVCFCGITPLMGEAASVCTGPLSRRSASGRAVTGGRSA